MSATGASVDARTMPSFGVVICAYSEARWPRLVEAVDSVRRQSQPPREVVVVIDHNDALLARARALFTDARVVANDGRLGLSGARNAGARRIASDLVAFLDDDACAEPDWLQTLAGAFADERVVGAGGWIVPRWEGPEPRWLAPELYWIIGCSYRGLPGAGADLRNAIGANMAFRREAIAGVGGFREGVGRVREQPREDEETEFAIRVRARWPQAQILHVPAARVQHAVPPERTTWRHLVARCWSEGRSKALLAREAGAGMALASERPYAARVLPVGVAHGLRDALRGDAAGLGRAAGIALALAVSATGYLLESLRQFAARA